MKLTTYYGRLAPKTVYRVVVNDGRVEGYFATPKAPRWNKSGSVVHELQAGRDAAVKISRDEALTIMTTWGGGSDDLDGSSWVSLPDFKPGAFAAKLEPQMKPAETLKQDWSPLAAETKKAATRPPRTPTEIIRLNEPFELWREDEDVSQKVEEDILVDRPTALSALRDLADGLTGLGQPGIGWT